MLQQKKPGSQAVDRKSSVSLPFATSRNTGTRPHNPSFVIRDVPLPVAASQSPDSLLSGRPTSPELSKLRPPNSFRQSVPPLDPIGTNDTAHDRREVMSPMGDIAIDENDIIIAAMGPTGTGKSTFVDIAVGRPDSGAGHGLVSCTQEIRAVRYPHPDGERNIVLVDTPGFDDTFVSDTQTLRNLAEWLKTTYKQKVMLSGLLYFHRISDNRVAGTPLRNLNMFKELCGRDNFKNVVLVTTMWSEVLEDVGLQREEELQNDFWKAMINLGSTTHRFHLTEESAWEIINAISVSLPEERRPLLIQQEMVDENKPLHKTSAGKTVLRSITDIFSGVKGFFRRSKTSKRTKDGRDKAPSLPRPPHPSRSRSSSSVSSDTTHSSMDGLRSTSNTSFSNSTGFPSEHSYRDALGGVITTLKLAHSVAEFVRIHCLKEAIVPSLSIAHAIEVIAPAKFTIHKRNEFLPQDMEEPHHELLRVVENAALLIGVITEHAQKVRITPEMKTAISGFAKDLKRADGIVQDMARRNSGIRANLQDTDLRTLTSCAESMRHACDVLRPKLSPDNRPALFRVDVGLAGVITALHDYVGIHFVS
ncbi:P-loop containing nucleoside triphosphate hydrolase protein [Scleroderma citrinum]